MKRQLDKSIENNLKSSSLWKNRLEPDCVAGKVFLAIRDNRIDFYHKGGKLFGFNGDDFKTHIKYASVITNTGRDYLTENELKTHTLALNFESNYPRIKENCKLFAGSEASGVSALYHKHSYVSQNSDVVVLDIEISFESQDEDSKQDRIDILLFHKKSRTLRFVEAKHFSNKEIWSDSTPKVIDQLIKYEGQVAKCKFDILSAYSQYVQIVNGIFGCDLPMPLSIGEKVTLLIFDFDRDQQNGRMKKLITEKSEYQGTQIYVIGNIDQIVPENLWSQAKILQP